MKLFICALIVGIALNSAWAIEVESEDEMMDKDPIQQSHLDENEITEPQNFSTLVKSTMDLLSPEDEKKETSETKL